MVIQNVEGCSKQSSIRISDLNDRIERTIRSIQTITNETSRELAFQIGKIVIEQFYCGNICIWRNRSHKDTSLRKLVQHKELPISASKLYYSIAIFELFERVNDRQRWHRLGVSHIRPVLRLTEDKQIELLDKADKNGWSVKKIEREVNRYKKNHYNAGRPCLPKLVKALRHIQASIQKHDSVFQDPMLISGLKDEVLIGLQQQLIELIQKIQAIENSLQIELNLSSDPTLRKQSLRVYQNVTPYLDQKNKQITTN